MSVYLMVTRLTTAAEGEAAVVSNARVLDVGQCSPDHGQLRALIETSFDATVDRAHTHAETLAAVRKHHYDLVLVNRLLDQDGSEGLRVIASLKADRELREIPMMLVSNFDEAQASAVTIGAAPGFGKAQLREPATHTKLAAFLPPRG